MPNNSTVNYLGSVVYFVLAVHRLDKALTTCLEEKLIVLQLNQA